ncbi:MAG: SNF2-related protein, partial [Granulosicoccus sp.]
MNNQPRVLNFDDVIDLCGSVATSRGQVYRTSGAVTELDWIPEANVLYAVVQDAEAEPYHARITIAPHRFDGECSCPARYNCKHVAASLLSWIERQTATPTPDDQALRKVNRWLQKMVEHGRKAAPAQEHHELGEPLMFYQLDSSPLTQSQNGITLQILQSRLLKRGGYGKETPYRYNGHYYHPDWVLQSDRAILELAVGKQNELAYRELTVEGDIGHLLMNKLIECGRCYWGADREKALSKSNSLSLQFQWEKNSSDHYILTTTLPGVSNWQLIPSDPPWYIDADELVAGQLENTPSVALLAQFIEAPPLPVAHAQAVSNYLASRLPDTSLPLPSAPNFVRIDETPNPVLVLQSREDSPDIRDFFASIKFRYADYVLPFDGMEADATLEGKTADGSPLVLKRDLQAEIRYSVEFGKHFPGFESAQQNDDNFYSKADRQPSTKDVQRMAREWRELLNARDEMQSRGWSVQVREPFDLSFQSVTHIEATVSETTSNWFDMALKLQHGEQQFDLLPLVIDWLQGDSRDSSILLQADDGQWLEVAPELFKPVADTLMELYDDPTGADSLRVPRQRAATLETLEGHWQRQGIDVAWHDAGNVFDLAERLRNFDGIERGEPPANVCANLRPYQLDGMAWLGFLAEFGFNGILADDMGLGKTMQIIALLLVLKKRRSKTPSLLVLPASLLANWKDELERYGPSLCCLFVHTSLMSKQEIEALANTDGAGLAGIDLVLTTYGMLLRQSWLQAQDWRVLILDEAQAIKNPASRQTRATKKLKATSRIALTGTPIENRLGDLWSLFDFLCPGLLGSASRFKAFTKSLAAGENDQYAPLRNLVRPYILRRLK